MEKEMKDTKKQAMITELTQEQIDSMKDFTKLWIDVGLNTDPIDQEASKKAVNLAYTTVGLTPPKEFKFFGSPKSGLEEARKYGGDIYTAIYGSFEASWISYYDFFNKHFNIAEAIVGIAEVAKTCGWVWVFDDLAIVTDRPAHIKFDDQKRLHAENGPAILYRDGFAVYSWHGTRIPASWMTEGITPSIALTWPNIEQRRAACEILGWAKIIKELNGKVLDTDVDPEIGSLVEVNIPEIGKEKFLQVKCGTGRDFALPVPPSMKTALEAQAWIIGLDPIEFNKAEIRT